jgi:hypothetical protein
MVVLWYAGGEVSWLPVPVACSTASLLSLMAAVLVASAHEFFFLRKSDRETKRSSSKPL